MNEPEAVTEKEPMKCWPSQNIHCENSLKLHACITDLKATLARLEQRVKELEGKP